MADPYLSAIHMFGGNFAPRNWAFCDGQILPIANNQALFSLLGTMYGGDGYSSFALPDVRGRVPIHRGEAPGLTPRPQGQMFGKEEVTLTAANLPGHTHTLRAADTAAAQASPENAVMAETETVEAYAGSGDTATLHAGTLATSGGSNGRAVGHENRMPLMALNFIICLKGTYPTRPS